MPMYTYRCATCGETTEVVRSLAESDLLPTTEEGGACSVDEKHGVVLHAWAKELQPFKMVRSPSWGGRKGGWGNH